MELGFETWGSKKGYAFMKNNQILKFNSETELHIGDYFRAYKSKYFTLVKDIAINQRDYEPGYGECYVTMIKVDIFDKDENLLAKDSIVPIDKLISGALAKYIPDINYDPTYLGSISPFKHPVEHKIWRDMVDRCFDYTNPEFVYIGAIGTTVCDRWRCFEYFFADFKHIAGFVEAGNSIYFQHYIVDLYDIQKHVHPSNRIYAPGYVKLKPFKESDICKYCNLSPSFNKYPKDLETTMKYKTNEIDIRETLFKKQTGMNVILNLDDACYHYDYKIGYQPLSAAMSINQCIPYIYNICNHQPMKEMCVIINKE